MFLLKCRKKCIVIEKDRLVQQRRDAMRQYYLASLEGKREEAPRTAVKAAITALNQHGWYADINGEMDVMESEIEQKIRSYLERHEPTI